MYLNPDLKYNPKLVISIVCPSRSGSTVIKHALGLHPDITVLAGEHEPYLKLTNHGYPWHSSDEFHELKNPHTIRLCIANEILGERVNVEANRKWLQDSRIEEPPYIEPIKCKRTDTLLLKTPQDCYRRGIMEQLYPDAEIKYIVIDRDPRAIVNGLIDGWETPGAFEARRVDGEWWKFDMPPGWSFERDALHRSVHQCTMARMYCSQFFPEAYKLKFEEFIEDWRYWCNLVWHWLCLPKHYGESVLEGTTLPVLMATQPPEPERWRKVRPWLDDLGLI